MIVLKDIKVSKTRIPVQNALWLRPIDKETYKIYYPSGGNWKEIVFETSEDMDNTLEPRVEALEKAMAQANVDISAIRKDFEEFETDYYRDKSENSYRVSHLEERITALENSFDSVISILETQITLVHVSDNFDWAAGTTRSYSRNQMEIFGFNELVFRSIYDGYCKKASILGNEYDITIEDSDAVPVNPKPGYGGNIVFTGESSIDAETGILSYIEYKIIPDMETTSIDDSIEIWEYTITKQTVAKEVEEEEEEEELYYLIASLRSDPSKKAYIAQSNFGTMGIGTPIYSNSELTIPAVSGIYDGESVVVDGEEILVIPFEVANGVITRSIEVEEEEEGGGINDEPIENPPAEEE